MLLIELANRLRANLRVRLGLVLAGVIGAGQGPGPARADTTPTILANLGSNGVGAYTYAGLTMDPNGNLYGVTDQGGNSNTGTVFMIASAPGEPITTLASIGGASGAYPVGALVFDSQGNLYGTTNGDGTTNQGTVFEVANDPSHTLSVLATFTGSNGASPYSGLAIDAAGNLYGTTLLGGSAGSGTAFMIANDANHTFTTLANFGGSQGSLPYGSVVVDATGNLYGTTSTGGAGGAGDGMVFKIANDAKHTLTTLVTFNGPNGSSPYGTPILDSQGNLFGTTRLGGPNDAGTVYEVANDAKHTLTTLASFHYDPKDPSTSNGANPYAGLAMDASGNLFGTTTAGGQTNEGTLFEVANDANHTLTTLYSFAAPGPSGPYGGVIVDSTGNLFGTSLFGGTNSTGTVYGFGNVSGGGGTVPEPATVVMLTQGTLLLGGLALSARLRRRARTAPVA